MVSTPPPKGSLLETVVRNFTFVEEIQAVRGAIEEAVSELISDRIRVPSNPATRACVAERIFNAAGQLASKDSFRPITRPDTLGQEPASFASDQVPRFDPDWFADLHIRGPLLCQACELIGYAAMKPGRALMEELVHALKQAMEPQSAADTSSKCILPDGTAQYEVKLGSKKVQLRVEAKAVQIYSSGKAAQRYELESITQWGDVAGHLQLNMLDETIVKMRTPDAKQICVKIHAAASALKTAHTASLTTSGATELRVPAASPKPARGDDSFETEVQSGSFESVLADMASDQKQYKVLEDGKKMRLTCGTHGLQLHANKKLIASYLYESISQWGNQGGYLQLNFEDGNIVKFKTDDASEISIQMSSAARKLADEQRAAKKRG
eukprot:SAG31_NODE_1147_length_9665_cov_10.571399_10_plen_382_part_00